MRSYRQSTPKRSFMSRLRSRPFGGQPYPHRLVAVLQLTEIGRAAHAEAVLIRVRESLMGHDDNGGRCALPLP